MLHRSMESFLVVAVPEAEASVAPVRERFDPSSRLGVPPHISILGPFLDPVQLTEGVLSEVSEALKGVAPFEFELDRVSAFGDAVYLAPTPTEPFVELTKLLWRQFPDQPPYGGRFEAVVPHLTVGWTALGASIEIVTELLDDRLPIIARHERWSYLSRRLTAG